MVFIYSLVALFIAWIWVDYYRLIDIYEKEDLKYFILIFILGGASVSIVFGLHHLFIDSLGWGLNGHFLNDFLYCTIQIGILEEFAKLIPFLIFYKLFHKEVNEPIDFIAYICVAALGFSAFENVMYFYRHGPQIIGGRAILSSVGHMFFTALIAYGIVRYKYQKGKRKISELILFFLYASLAHGFYDFWLMYSGINTVVGILITILFFLFGLSTFATILNNALNNSNFFDHKLVINPNKIASRLIGYYVIVFILQFAILVHLNNFETALGSIGISLAVIGFIVVVTSIRMSRFQLIQHRWENLTIELPFRVVYRESISGKYNRWAIRFNGDSFNETQVSAFFQEYFQLNELNRSNPQSAKKNLAYIQKKVFLRNKEAIYIVSIYDHNEFGASKLIAIKSKRDGIKIINKEYPIVAIMDLLDLKKVDDPMLTIRNFKFRSWAYLKERNGFNV
jgi:RsiW-degrading membrane proteinase PrsW (M82 family)